MYSEAGCKYLNRTKMVILNSVFDGCPGDLGQPKNLQHLKPFPFRADYESPLTTACEFDSPWWETCGGLSVEAPASLLPVLLEPLVLAGTDVGLCSVMVSTGA